MIIVCFRAILDDWNVYSEFMLDSVEFLEISKNRLAVLKARQTTHAPRAYFLGFSYAPPSG